MRRGILVMTKMHSKFLNSTLPNDHFVVSILQAKTFFMTIFMPIVAKLQSRQK